MNVCDIDNSHQNGHSLAFIIINLSFSITFHKLYNAIDNFEFRIRNYYNNVYIVKLFHNYCLLIVVNTLLWQSGGRLKSCTAVAGNEFLLRTTKIFSSVQQWLNCLEQRYTGREITAVWRFSEFNVNFGQTILNFKDTIVPQIIPNCDVAMHNLKKNHILAAVRQLEQPKVIILAWFSA